MSAPCQAWPQLGRVCERLEKIFAAVRQGWEELQTGAVSLERAHALLQSPERLMEVLEPLSKTLVEMYGAVPGDENWARGVVDCLEVEVKKRLGVSSTWCLEKLQV